MNSYASIYSMGRNMNLKLQWSFWTSCCILCHNHQMSSLWWYLRFSFSPLLPSPFPPNINDGVTVTWHDCFWHLFPSFLLIVQGASSWYQHWIWRHCQYPGLLLRIAEAVGNFIVLDIASVLNVDCLCVHF